MSKIDALKSAECSRRQLHTRITAKHAFTDVSRSGESFSPFQANTPKQRRPRQTDSSSSQDRRDKSPGRNTPPVRPASAKRCTLTSVGGAAFPPRLSHPISLTSLLFTGPETSRDTFLFVRRRHSDFLESFLSPPTRASEGVKRPNPPRRW